MTTDELIKSFQEIEARKTDRRGDLIIQKCRDSIAVLTELQQAGVTTFPGKVGSYADMIQNREEIIRDILAASRG